MLTGVMLLRSYDSGVIVSVQIIRLTSPDARFDRPSSFKYTQFRYF